MMKKILPTQIQEKIKKEIIEALKIDSGNIVQSISKGTETYLCIESAVIHDFNLETIKKYDLDFTNCVFRCKTIFDKSDINFAFFNCSFDKTYIAYNQSIMEATLHFYHCKFLGDFYISNFIQGDFYAENCYFNNTYLAYSKLPEKTTFKNCNFQCGLNLQNAHSSGLISFYGTTFFDCPNFSRIQFENICLINTKLAFGYEKLEYEIIKTWQEESKYSSYVGGKHFVANDFRDSFRLFKNILSKEGNILDASDYHRMELYCKEIELDSKPQKSWRDRIDSLQLWFYRHLCNHHTDLLRVWNSLMYLIFIFGVLSFGAMAWFAYYFDDNFSLANYFDSTHLRIFYDSHIKIMIHKHPLRIWGINLGFIALFLFLFLGLTSKICRWIFVIPSYLVSIGMFAISPKLLIPAIGFFTDKREILDPLSIVGGAYTLLFGLIAYSLIKTARKNSIIPS